jgi:hypothetical protein
MEGLKYVPQSCTDNQKVLAEELRNARAATTSAAQAGGAARSAAANPSPGVRQAPAPSKSPAPSDPGSGVPSAFTGSGNPYRQEDGGGNSPSAAWDPVAEARAAMGRGDTRGAIRILEQGGNSRTVLALLASLYRQIGDETNYRDVARKFLKLYPTDPKASQFKRDLGL